MQIKKLLSIGFVALLFLSMIIAVSAMPRDGVVDDPHPANAIWVDPNSWETSPELDTLQYCDTFIVDVFVNITYGLYGWEYRLEWDSTNINLTDHQIHILPGWPPGFIILNEVGVYPNYTGFHHCVVSALPPAPSFSGVRSLCTYEFHVIETIYEPDPPEIGTLDIQDDIIRNDMAELIPHSTDDGEYRICPTPPPIVFRLLAVEKYFALQGNDASMKSAQYLISALLGYVNWSNGTCQGQSYLSYIHLLTECEPPYANRRGMWDNMTRFYRGKVTRANVINEIVNFLDQGGDVLVFYYIGHGGSNCTNYFMDLNGDGDYDLDVDIGDYELDALLPISANKSIDQWENCTVVILDSCHSEEACTNIGRPGRDVMVACKKNETAYGWIRWAGDPSNPIQCHDGNWGWFTGRTKIPAWEGVPGAGNPLGVIGGLLPANDLNGDGWIQTREAFAFAGPSTTAYATADGKTQTPQSYWGFIPPGVPLVALCTHPYPEQIPKLLADVDANGLVDIVDIVIVALAFGTKPGDPDWNPIADPNQDGIVDIVDIVMVAIHFGETHP